MFIDSHCHLESFVRNKTLTATLQNAANADVREIICIGTDMEDWSLYHDLARDHPSLHYSVGLHPCHVDENWNDAVTALSPWFIGDTLPVALGEIGLDNFHLPKDADAARALQKMQEDAFRHQLAIAYQLDCPVVIHSRNAFADCVRLIDESGVNWNKVVFHCFSEGPDAMTELNKRGGRGSFTGVLTYPKAQAVRDAALAQGLDKLMLETDAPYLSPQPKRGKPNEPAYLRHTAEFAAELFGVTVERLAEITTANTRKFFEMK